MQLQTNTLTAAQLFDMVHRQERTNAAYTGADWRESMEKPKLIAAIIDEAGEFLREVKPTWKWWDKNAKAEREKALFEAVDLIHFALIMYLYYKDPKKIVDESYFSGAIDGARYVLNEYQFIGLSPLEHFNNHLGVVLNHQIFPVTSVLHLQAACCSILGYTSEEFYQAYLLKNNRNLERVAKGVMMGVDVKADEKELHLV